jgi:carbon starvation protein CstA
MPDKIFSDDQIKHLEFIQGVVTRMGSNSFQMKGWMVVIVSALLAIYADNNNGLYPLFALIPVVIFWGLDSYYLWQERKFRGLYNDVAGITNIHKAELVPFAMRPDLYTPKDKQSYAYWDVVISKTIVALYVPVVVILLTIYFLLTP